MKKFNNLLIKDNFSISRAIKALNKNELRVCFVVNSKNKLIGSITDGDIRRALVKKISFNENVKKICNIRPLYLYKNKTIHIKILKRKDITCIPIVDKKKNIVDVIKTNHQSKIKTALIMAGGFGKRLLPLTLKKPKALIRFKNKSLIEHLIIKLKKNGFKNIYISIHYLGKQIEKKLKNGKKLGVKIFYIKEKKPLGTAGSLAFLNKHFGDNFLVVNCDVNINIDFQKMIDFHIKRNSDLTIIAKLKTTKINFGIIKIKKNLNINSILEKPVYTNFINTGVYIFNKSVKKLIKKNFYLDMDKLISKMLLNKKYKVMGYPIFEDWNDLGTHYSLSKS
jgi:dTDP-glucose pyrophosphorylase